MSGKPIMLRPPRHQHRAVRRLIFFIYSFYAYQTALDFWVIVASR